MFPFSFLFFFLIINTNLLFTIIIIIVKLFLNELLFYLGQLQWKISWLNRLTDNKSYNVYLVITVARAIRFWNIYSTEIAFKHRGGHLKIYSKIIFKCIFFFFMTLRPQYNAQNCSISKVPSSTYRYAQGQGGCFFQTMNIRIVSVSFNEIVFFLYIYYKFNASKYIILILI